nr:hypothetical protein [Psychromicrobium silvestre]
MAAAGILLSLLAVAGCSSPAPQASESSTASSTAASTQSASSSSSASNSSTGTATASGTPSSKTQSTVGALVADFPKTLLPLLPGASIKLSAVDKSNSPATVSLVGTTKSTSKAIVDFYTKSFKAQGFTLLAGGDIGSVVSKDFVRKDGKESINLSISSDAGTNTFTLGASVETASLK